VVIFKTPSKYVQIQNLPALRCFIVFKNFIATNKRL